MEIAVICIIALAVAGVIGLGKRSPDRTGTRAPHTGISARHTEPCTHPHCHSGFVPCTGIHRVGQRCTWCQDSGRMRHT